MANDYNEYDLGDEVRCTGTYTDSAGTVQDPAAVFFQVEDPSGNKTTYQYSVDAELVKASTGVYYVDVDLDECGFWTYRHYSTGLGQAAAEKRMRVKESRFD